MCPASPFKLRLASPLPSACVSEVRVDCYAVPGGLLSFSFSFSSTTSSVPHPILSGLMSRWLFPWSGSIKKRACRYLLQHYLGHFLEERLSLDQLSLDLYNGSGVIKEINLDVWVSELTSLARCLFWVTMKYILAVFRNFLGRLNIKVLSLIMCLLQFFFF